MKISQHAAKSKNNESIKIPVVDCMIVLQSEVVPLLW